MSEREEHCERCGFALYWDGDKWYNQFKVDDQVVAYQYACPDGWPHRPATEQPPI